VSPSASRRRRLPVGERVAEDVADAMFALSTPSRVLILGLLLSGPHSVTELADGLEMEQSAVSHQLRVLRQHALVAVVRDGKRRVYTLHDEHVVELLEGALRHVEHRRTGRIAAVRRRASR